MSLAYKKSDYVTCWQVFIRLQRFEALAHVDMQRVKAGIDCSKMWDWRKRDSRHINTSEDVLKNVEFLLHIKQLILRGSDFNFGLG